MGLLGELRRWWEERSYPCHLDFAAVSEQTRDSQRQEEAVTFCRQRWEDWPYPCHGDEFQPPVARLACSSKRLPHLSGQSPVVRLRAPTPSAQRHCASVKFGTAKFSVAALTLARLWFGWLECKDPQQALERMPREYCVFNMLRWTSRKRNLLLSRRNSSKSLPSTVGTF